MTINSNGGPGITRHVNNNAACYAIKAAALIGNCLRWLTWAIHCLIIWPAATLVLIVVLVFCVDNTTPGAVAVDYLQKASSITDGQHWRWHECVKAKPVAISERTASLQPKACPEAVSDARGYAAYIDRTLWEILSWLWVLLVLIYGGLIWVLGIRPHFSRYNR